MGITYKLKPEVINFIIEAKKANPHISCRGMVALVYEKFNFKVSKSSINALSKQAGLSLPIGRRSKTKKPVIPSRILDAIAQASQALELTLPNQEIVETPIQPELEKVIPVDKDPIEEKKELLPEVKEEIPKEEVIEEIVEIKEEVKASEELIQETPEPITVVEEPKEEIIEPKEVISEPVVEEVLAQEVKEPKEEIIEKQEEIPAQVIKTEPVVEEVVIQPAIEPRVEPAFPEVELPVEANSLGALMLKLVDSLVGGSKQFVEAIKFRLPNQENILAKSEFLLYSSLFGDDDTQVLSKKIDIEALIGYKLDSESLNSFLNEARKNHSLPSEILRIISLSFQEARGVHVRFSDDSVIFLDGQFHSLWSSPQVPYDFSSLLPVLKNNLRKCFSKTDPFVFFFAPGYDFPTKETFQLISGLNSEGKYLNRLGIYGNKFEELEVVSLDIKKHYYIFSLWPWQFGQFRELKLSSDFHRFFFYPGEKEIFIADGELVLIEPNTNKRFTLRACAVKMGANEKIKCVILTNLPQEKAKTEELVTTFLNNWPNLDETFEDFSRKVELFTYTVNSQQFFNIDSLNLGTQSNPDLKTLFGIYLKGLDLYLRRHFFPPGYEKKTFEEAMKSFYSLRMRLEKKAGFIKASFKLPPEYPFKNDLFYVCRRLNEANFIFSDGSKVWFSL